MKCLTWTKRLSLAGLLLACVFPMYAQESLVSISVEPKGAPYLVDGIKYFAPTSFTWPKGSKHFLQLLTDCVFPSTAPMPNDCQTRYSPGSWTTNKGGLLEKNDAVIVLTADPDITSVLGASLIEHRIRLIFFDAGGAAQDPIKFPRDVCLGPRLGPGGPGAACLNGTCYKESREFWLPPGTVLSLQAVPYDGFVFRQWYSDDLPEPFVGSFTVRGPTILHPRFEPGKRVVIATDPPELHVLVDRTEIYTADPKNYIPSCLVTGLFDFAEGSTHVLGALSPQVDIRGVEWVFDKWSNGGGQNMVYKAENTNISETLVAKFVRGIRVSLGLPKGLKLIVDGRDTWPSHNFIWGAGTKHVLTAPAEQTDENGRKYIFKGWSNGASPTQELTLSTSDFTGMQIKAEYEMLGMINIQSNVPVAIKIGEETCQTPCLLHRTTGSEVSVSIPTTIPVSEGARYELQSLGGETSGVKMVQFTADGSFISANYRPAYRVAANSEPPNGATIRMEPASPDAFYPPNTRVQVYATSKLGYKFKHWAGDTVDRFSPATVSVSGPMRLTAVLEAAPAISDSGVKNGAGETPVNAVAPGSIISIYGANLAPATEVGPANPLTQTIAGSTVLLAGRILPLLFVSPEQINAQLPYDLAAGTQMLTVNNKEMPAVNASFEVIRNAPGLITHELNGRPSLLAVRADGVPVTSENPLKGGEMINLYGTGFGPHRISPPEGFGVDEVDAYRLADPVQVIIGDQTIAPDYVGSAKGRPGVVVVRFRTPAGLSDQSLSSLKVVVNGIASNEALLPTAGAYTIKPLAEAP